MVHQGPLGTGQYRYPVFASEVEPLHFQVPNQIIQEVHNPQESQQDRRIFPLNGLSMWEVSQEAVEDQRQSFMWVN